MKEGKKERERKKERIRKKERRRKKGRIRKKGIMNYYFRRKGKVRVIVGVYVWGGYGEVIVWS